LVVNPEAEIAGLSHSVGVKAQTGGPKNLAKFTACKVPNPTVYLTRFVRAKNISFALALYLLCPSTDKNQARCVVLSANACYQKGANDSLGRPAETRGGCVTKK
jgi:hypothetical protein